MKLSLEEKQILKGDHGETIKNVLQTLVDYGNLVGAKNFVPITSSIGQVHFSYGTKAFDNTISILNKLSTHGVKSKIDLVSNPKPFANFVGKLKLLNAKPNYKKVYFNRQDVLEKELKKLNVNTYACGCFENQNAIAYGDVCAWSESVAITYINSVLGARSNENPPLIDLFCNIMKKTLNYGLLLDENRKAGIAIKLEVNKEVDPQLLGETVAKKCENKIPIIYGLEKILKTNLDQPSLAFLKDFSAGFSCGGKVRLFHINGITPEAKLLKKQIVKSKVKTVIIDEQELEKNKQDYEILWKNPESKAKLCILGCPHLSLYQLVNLTNEIGWELRQNKRNKLKIKTYFLTSSKTLEKFKELPEFKELIKYGGIISTFCPLMGMNLKKISKTNIITNSNKLRCFSTAKFFEEEQIIKQICGRRGK